MANVPHPEILRRPGEKEAGLLQDDNPIFILKFFSLVGERSRDDITSLQDDNVILIL